MRTSSRRYEKINGTEPKLHVYDVRNMYMITYKAKTVLANAKWNPNGKHWT